MKPKPTKLRVSHVCEAMQTIAPPQLAQSWDNVGLLAGDVSNPARTALLCIDLTPEVAREAIKLKTDVVIAYHPPIFKPIATITAQSRGPEAAVFRCIENGIAVYAVHTALDAADGGTNDCLAALCGIKETEPLEYVYDLHGPQFKVVTFVPPANLDAVTDAMFHAGAGHIGDYSHCSYRLEGQGTFLGSDQTNPAIGKAGRLETVQETRIEMVCPERRLPAVINALVRAHPYEEPAFDIYPVKSGPVRGIGRRGALPATISLGQLAQKLRKALGAKTAQIVGEKDQSLDRAVIVAGAAGSLPFRTPLAPNDVIITGEIRHHDALTIRRLGCTAIALGHSTSERPVLDALAKRLPKLLPGLIVKISQTDCEPFEPV